MKNNNKNNKFNKKNFPDKHSTCSCGAKTKLKTNVNYPFGKKSKAVKSQFYKCEKCGETKFVIAKKGGRK